MTYDDLITVQVRTVGESSGRTPDQELMSLARGAYVKDDLVVSEAKCFGFGIDPLAADSKSTENFIAWGTEMKFGSGHGVI